MGIYDINLSNTLFKPSSVANTGYSPAVNTNNFVSTSPTLNKYASNTSTTDKVLGLNTTATNTSNQSAPSNTTNPFTTTNAEPNLQNEITAQQEAYRNEIGSGYDVYLNNLQNMLDNNLPMQRTAQEGIIQSQLDTGTGTLDAQKSMGLNDLGLEENKVNTNQVKTLKDVSTNIRNSMQAGNNYLGVRGAGDSSAVNQYSYALTKLGSQQRGDVMSQTANLLNEINSRKFKLNTTYNDEINRLNNDAQQKMLGVQSWFFEAQNELRSQMARAGFDKSMDLANMSKTLLDQAMQRLNNLQAEQSNKRSMLETWAVNNSNNIGELMKNWTKISQYVAPNVTASPINGQINTGAPTSQGVFYGGSNNSNEDDLFN